MTMKGVTILINARNEEENISRCLESLLKQEYDKKGYEILVVDDASSDRTGDIVKAIGKDNKNVVYKRYENRQGRVKCINLALNLIKNPYFIEFNADCEAERDWLKKIISGFRGKDVGIVKASSLGEGVSTAFRTDLVRKIGGVDERYNEFGASLRYDSDIILSIKELGYRIVFVDAKYRHFQKKPKSFRQKIKYSIYRAKVHRFDVLLYKKHPELAKEILRIKLGFLRSPMEDFRVATGLWGRDKKLRLSSPQGISILDNKSIFHLFLIIILGWVYVFSVKFARLYGSLIYKKLLI